MKVYVVTAELAYRETRYVVLGVRTDKAQAEKLARRFEQGDAYAVCEVTECRLD